MKRKTVERFAVALAAGMLATFSTGCGARASATDAEVPLQEETVIVTQESTDMESDDGIIVETERVDETTDDELVGDDNFVFYAEYIGKFVDEPLDTFNFETIDKEVTIEDDFFIEKGDVIVGYIKGGSTIKLIEHGIDTSVYRVENSSGVGYKYIYLTEDAFMTLDDMKEFISKHLRTEISTVIDTPEAGMKYIEFTVEKSMSSGVEDYICECLEDIQYTYNTFCVECTKNDDMVDVRVYYK